MKFLDWLAPDLWWQLTVTPECESPGTELFNAVEFFAVQTQSESKTDGRFFLKASFQQRTDYEWNPVIPYVDHSEQKHDASEPAPKHTVAYTHTNTNTRTQTVECSHSFSVLLVFFFLYLFSLCSFYIYRNKGWPEHACLTYVRVGVYIREKVLFFFSSPIVCCFWCGHMVVDWNVKSWEMSDVLSDYVNVLVCVE